MGLGAGDHARSDFQRGIETALVFDVGGQFHGGKQADATYFTDQRVIRKLRHLLLEGAHDRTDMAEHVALLIDTQGFQGDGG